MVKELPNMYFLVLDRLQQYEESRINFLKNSLHKFTKNIQRTGIQITELQSHTQLVSSETDVLQFINYYRTD